MSKNTDKPYRIAIDVMGGDHAPLELVKGAMEAARQGIAKVLMVGDVDQIQEISGGQEISELPITVVPSEGVIVEEEHPVRAFRQKPKASVITAAGLVKSGHADAFVSLGSTGAAMAAATLTMGLMHGLERPALGGAFLSLAPKASIIDLGSSIDCRPSQLLNFAAIGAVYATKLLGIQNPRVALLSVGTEENKGNRQVQEAYSLFKRSGLNFVGNVEGYDLFTDKCDVIVCDGFVGNILMKYSEGLLGAVAAKLRDALRDKLPEEEQGKILKNLGTLSGVTEGSGGPLFGVNGVAIVGHGSSKAPTVTRAIAMASKVLGLGLVEAMERDLLRVQDAMQTQPGGTM